MACRHAAAERPAGAVGTAQLAAAAGVRQQGRLPGATPRERNGPTTLLLDIIKP